MMSRIAIVLMVGMFLFANMHMMILAYSYLAAAMMIRAWRGNFKKRIKTGLCTVYFFALAMQIAFTIIGVFGVKGTFVYYPAKLFAVVLTILPFVFEQFVLVNKSAEFYLPSTEDVTTITFQELRTRQENIIELFGRISNASKSLSPENVKAVFYSLPTHSATKYVNNGSLTDEYMTSAYATLDDPHIYLAISNTGSAASEIISVFTQKQYNTLRFHSTEIWIQ
jgi:hypothetical protein